MLKNLAIGAVTAAVIANPLAAEAAGAGDRQRYLHKAVELYEIFQVAGMCLKLTRRDVNILKPTQKSINEFETRYRITSKETAAAWNAAGARTQRLFDQAAARKNGAQLCDTYILVAILLGRDSRATIVQEGQQTGTTRSAPRGSGAAKPVPDRGANSF